MHRFKTLINYFAQILEQSTLRKSLMLAKTILYQVHVPQLRSHSFMI